MCSWWGWFYDICCTRKDQQAKVFQKHANANSPSTHTIYISTTFTCCLFANWKKHQHKQATFLFSAVFLEQWCLKKKNCQKSLLSLWNVAKSVPFTNWLLLLNQERGGKKKKDVAKVTRSCQICHSIQFLAASEDQKFNQETKWLNWNIVVLFNQKGAGSWSGSVPGSLNLGTSQWTRPHFHQLWVEPSLVVNEKTPYERSLLWYSWVCMWKPPQSSKFTRCDVLADVSRNGGDHGSTFFSVWWGFYLFLILVLFSR